MAVPQQIPIVTYTANGVTSKFPITFDLHDDRYLVVTVNKERPPVGAYQVVDGDVVFRTAPTSGDEVTLARDTVPDRETDFKSYNNSMRPEVFNYDFDKIWHFLQEQNLIDAISLGRLKDEIEWRRTHDFNYDELSKARDAQVFGSLKQYVDTFIGATNPNIFGGVTAGVVFALDQKSVQTHIEDIADQLEQSRKDIDDRATKSELSKKADKIETEKLGRDKADLQYVKNEIKETNSKISATAQGFLIFSFESDLLKEKPETEPVAGKAYDTRKEWVWETRAPEDQPKWHDTGMSDSDRAKLYVDGFDAITLNRNKAYPLKAISRNGGVSPINKNFASFILDVRVYGADPKKVYKIDMFMNGATTSGWDADGWSISEYSATGFPTSTEPNRIVQPWHPQDGLLAGVNKILIAPRDVDGLLFEITYDSSQLPQKGKIISSATEGTDGYSWIIDPVCYVYGSVMNKYNSSLDSISLNAGKTYPLDFVRDRGGISRPPGILKDLLLDVKIHNADPKKLYKIEWISNGSTEIGGKKTGWNIAAYDKETFSESVQADRVLVVNLREEQSELSESIDKITIHSKSTDGLMFEITYDGSKLPQHGTYIRSSLTIDDGYNYFVDTTCNIESIPKNTPTAPSSGTINYSFDSKLRRISVDFSDAGIYYKWVFGINGFNDLPNFVSIHKSTDRKTWTQINSEATDWLPPFRVKARENGDGRGKFATGGNHGSVTQQAAGFKTAINDVFNIKIDGELLDTSRDSAGSCVKINVTILNRVMGWNTTPTESFAGRYIIRQAFNLCFFGNSVSVNAHNTALEDVELARDSALQCYNAFINEAFCYYGKTLKEKYQSESTSGAKSSNSKVFGVGSFGKNSDQLVMWIDKNFEAGDGRMIAENSILARTGGNKAYLAVANDIDENNVDIGTLVSIKKGESYKYRGGYCLKNAAAASAGFDSDFTKLYRDNDLEYIAVTSDAQVISI